MADWPFLPVSLLWPLYFSEALSTQPEPPAYRGCMRKLVVNGAPVTMTASVHVQGAVGASGCPSGTLTPNKQGEPLTQRQVGSRGPWQVNPIALPLLQH